MNKMKSGKKGWVIVKLDLFKAYNKVNRDFLKNVLLSFHFSSKWVNLILIYVSTVNHFVLINGNPSDSFSPRCGLRQGDPLSPYLFILCMKVLSSLINMEVEDGSWIPFKIKNLIFSHLLFADNVLLFSRTDKSSIEALNRCLNQFLSSLSLIVNYDKSSLWFSKNSRSFGIQRAKNILNIRSSSSLGTYLGFPLDVSSRIKDFKTIKDKILANFDLWKSKHLSLSGKATLINLSLWPKLRISCKACFFPKLFVVPWIKLSMTFLGGSRQF